MDINQRVRNIQDKFIILKSKRDEQIEKLKKLNKEREETLHNIDVRINTINFVEAVASNERLNVKDKVEKLITSCLQSVYDDSYSVEFEYGMRGTKTSVEIYVMRKCDDGMIIKRTIDGIGGGVADTVALPLKLIVLMNDPEFDKVLITDEPGKHLDTTRIVNFAKFLQSIVHKLGIQIIMSSHHACMNDYADSIHRVTLDDSLSRVERIK